MGGAGGSGSLGRVLESPWGVVMSREAAAFRAEPRCGMLTRRWLRVSWVAACLWTVPGCPELKDPLWVLLSRPGLVWGSPP